MLFTVGFPHIFVRGWLSVITQWLGRILKMAVVLHLLERDVSGTTCKRDVFSICAAATRHFSLRKIYYSPMMQSSCLHILLARLRWLPTSSDQSGSEFSSTDAGNGVERRHTYRTRGANIPHVRCQMASSPRRRQRGLQQVRRFPHIDANAVFWES
ncbi:hypothetical protein BD413DRAFT_504413 [Trametes elegans]|nr:hypothetical protein BD413DRAFT_504413 [Trametes elegans]